MGVPSFFSWLSGMYPDAVVDAVEDPEREVNGVFFPPDSSLPNPNGVEFDNLYLDMNGIIHPCFHPERASPPKTYEEVFRNIFFYLDRVFSIARPRKLLFIGIDGVAPRAKMNQQRSRRFRAAKEEEDGKTEVKKIRGKSIKVKLPPSALDSNVITPGTEFMDLLSSVLRDYIQLKINEDPGWQGIKVILSDSYVPGEGEHKIMSYVRLQRNLPGYDPNTRHCLYGLDADLVMLALATHEAHFTILREEMSNGKLVLKKRRKDIPSRLREESNLKNSLNGKANLQKKLNPALSLNELVLRLKFKFLNIWVLREHLMFDMRIPNSRLETDLERLIDDFILICMFAGNDFLPPIPTLEISKGAIDLLMEVYRKEFLQMGGYLTNSFEIDFTRLEHFIQAVGSHDGVLFRNKNQRERRKNAKRKERNLKRKFEELQKKGPNVKSTSDQSSLMEKIQHKKNDWKEGYYARKFKATTKDDQESIQRDTVLKYMEGICWVMRYYYEGVCSWQWFYPYHYAPFASDFNGLNQLNIQFTLGEPFKPLDQLMAVLPAASAHALPTLYQTLMTDASSPILDFYPSDFELDMNGKRHKWQAICKLPFIEESRLLSEIAKVEHTLKDDERQRNKLGSHTLFLHISHPLADVIINFSKQNCDPNMSQQIDPKISGGMNGFICISDKAVLPEEVYSPVEGMPRIAHNRVVSVSYKYPMFHNHISKLPHGVIMPVKSVSKQDISPQLLQHETFISKVVSARSPIPKDVSGRHLHMAHQLVSSCCPTIHEVTQGYKRPQNLVDVHKLGEVSTEANSRKRKRSIDNKVTTDEKCNGMNRRECEHMQQNMEQCNPCQQSGGNNNAAVKKTKTECQIARQKRKKQNWLLNRRKRREGSGVHVNDVVQLAHCIHKEVEGKNIESTSSCTKIVRLDSISGQRQADAHVGAPGILETEMQVKSKKRKSSDKDKQIEVDGADKKVKTEAQVAKWKRRNERMKLKQLMKREDSGVLDNNVVQLEHGIRRNDIQGEGNNIENLDTCTNIERLDSISGKRQGDAHVDAPGVQSGGKREAEFNGVPNSDTEVGSTAIGKQACGEVDNASLGASAEIKTDIGFKKKKKQRSKGSNVLDKSLEKLETADMSKQAEHDGNIVVANGLGIQSWGKRDAKFNDVSNSRKEVGSVTVGKQAFAEDDNAGPCAAVEMKTEIGTKKKKRRRSKGSVLNNSLEKLETDDPHKQAEHDGNSVFADGLVAQSWGEREADVNGVPNGDGEVRKPAIGKQACGEADNTGLVASAEMKTEIKSKKKKKKKRQQSKGSVLNNYLENL